MFFWRIWAQLQGLFDFSFWWLCYLNHLSTCFWLFFLSSTDDLFPIVMIWNNSSCWFLRWIFDLIWLFFSDLSGFYVMIAITWRLLSGFFACCWPWWIHRLSFWLLLGRLLFLLFWLAGSCRRCDAIFWWFCWLDRIRRRLVGWSRRFICIKQFSTDVSDGLNSRDCTPIVGGRLQLIDRSSESRNFLRKLFILELDSFQAA